MLFFEPWGLCGEKILWFSLPLAFCLFASTLPSITLLRQAQHDTNKKSGLCFSLGLGVFVAKKFSLFFLPLCLLPFALFPFVASLNPASTSSA